MATAQALHNALRQLESKLADQLLQIEETRRKIQRIKADLAGMDPKPNSKARRQGRSALSPPRASSKPQERRSEALQKLRIGDTGEIPVPQEGVMGSNPPHKKSPET